MKITRENIIHTAKRDRENKIRKHKFKENIKQMTSGGKGKSSLPSEPRMSRNVKIHTSILDIYLIITIKIMDRTVGKIKDTQNII